MIANPSAEHQEAACAPAVLSGAGELTCRDLRSHQDLESAAALETEIWGYTDRLDALPPSLLSASIRVGGLLLGAFDADRLVGFVYSFPAIRNGETIHWSHRLGVAEAYRSTGVGHWLKLEQRRRVAALGLNLVAWTYDPMLAANAHLNLTKLRATAARYETDVYGTSSSPLHAGIPTDRLVVDWRIGGATGEPDADRSRRRHTAICDAPVVNRTRRGRVWPACAALELSCPSDTVRVEIPLGFTQMLRRDRGLALQWRLATRAVFTTYFGAGFTAVDFAVCRDRGLGWYLLTR
ncbi:MAG: hypothetical protein ACRD26_23205 [Vicinamibacterales bacterium]